MGAERAWIVADPPGDEFGANASRGTMPRHGRRGRGKVDQGDVGNEDADRGPLVYHDGVTRDFDMAIQFEIPLGTWRRRPTLKWLAQIFRLCGGLCLVTGLLVAGKYVVTRRSRVLYTILARDKFEEKSNLDMCKKGYISWVE